MIMFMWTSPAGSLRSVMALPRTAIKDDNTVWVNQNNTLDIRKVTLAWKDETNVYIQKGISPGDQVVVSDLSTPVQGMALKSADSVAQKTQD